jgi:MraZ protein
MPAMFLGEYEHNLDDKGRLAVPARFREELGEGVVITRGFDHCLMGFPRPRWEELAERVSGLSLGHGDARNMRRLLFSGAADIQLDRQGRILIPQNLREYAGLSEQVIVAGLNTHFEIWSGERWHEVLDKLDETGSAIAEQLAALGI